MASPHPARTLVVLALAVTLGACSEQTTDPTLVKPRQPPVVLLKAEVASRLLVGVTDLIERVIPSLDEPAQRSPLTDALSSLAAVLTTRELAELRPASERLSAAFEVYAAAKENSLIDPDLASVRLLVDQVLYISMNPPLDTLNTK